MRRSLLWFVILLWLMIGSVWAQPGSNGPEILVNRDNVNVRLFPAIGAEVLGFVQAGWRAPATGRSGDGQWIRIDFNGEEGWLGFPVINLFGDINALPVADPRSIPFGGFESPRSGTTSATSPVTGRLADSGLRVRAGPSRAYPVLANAPRYTVFPLLGRTRNNSWLQVNFEGTLGWVTTPWVTIQGGSLIDLPLDGIVADMAPLSDASADSYIATLKLMLSRLDLAQPTLDTMRSIWTGIALGELAACGNYPPRPNNVNIANPILAANYPNLEPLRVLFNDAMTNVRNAVDLWIEVCSRPQPARGTVGAATVSGALSIVNFADQQFSELRRRLTALIPPDIELGPDECLFSYQNATDILKILPIGEIGRGTLDAVNTVEGYCFDAVNGQNLRFEAIQVSGNATLRLSISPIDNPTAFIANGLSSVSQPSLSVGPITIVTPGRYLLIVSHDDPTLQGALVSDFAVLITDVAGSTIVGPGIQLNPETGQPEKVSPTVPNLLTPIAVTTTPATTAVICPSLTFTCDMFLSCEEAQACYALGLTRLDADGDGIPCDLLCEPAP